MRHVCVFLSRIRAVVHSKCIWASHDALHSILVMFLLRFSLSLLLFFCLLTGSTSCFPFSSLLVPLPVLTFPATRGSTWSGKRWIDKLMDDSRCMSMVIWCIIMRGHEGVTGEGGGRGNYVKSCRLSDAQRSPKCFISPSFELCLRGSFELIVSRFAFSLFVSSFVRSFVSFWFLRSVACSLFWLSFCSCNGARP